MATIKSKFCIDYLDHKKDDNINITMSRAKSHMYDKYNDHLQIFSDGSLIETVAGAGFTRPYHPLKCNFFFQAEDGIRDVERSRGLGECV